MNGRRDDADKKLDALLSDIANEKIRESSPEYYATKMEKLVQGKKELEAKQSVESPLAKVGKEDPGIITDISVAHHPYKSTTAGKSNSGVRQRTTAILAVAAMLVFLICGTLITRDSLRNTKDPITPNRPVEVVSNPDGAKISAADIVDTSEVKNPSESQGGFIGFLQDMWLFIKAVFPYMGGVAVLLVITIIIWVHHKKTSKNFQQ